MPKSYSRLAAAQGKELSREHDDLRLGVFGPKVPTGLEIKTETVTVHGLPEQRAVIPDVLYQPRADRDFDDGLVWRETPLRRSKGFAPTWGRLWRNPPEFRGWAAEQPDEFPFEYHSTRELKAIARGEAPGYFPNEPDDRPRRRLGGYAQPRWDLIESWQCGASRWKKQRQRQLWGAQPTLPRVAIKLLPWATLRRRPKAEMRAELEPMVNQFIAFVREATPCPPETTTRMLNKRPVGRPKSGLTETELAKLRKQKQRAKSNLLKEPIREAEAQAADRNVPVCGLDQGCGATRVRRTGT